MQQISLKTNAGMYMLQRHSKCFVILLSISATLPLCYQKPRVKFCHLLEIFPQRCLLTATSAYGLP